MAPQPVQVEIGCNLFFDSVERRQMTRQEQFSCGCTRTMAADVNGLKSTDPRSGSQGDIGGALNSNTNQANDGDNEGGKARWRRRAMLGEGGRDREREREREQDWSELETTENAKRIDEEG